MFRAHIHRVQSIGLIGASIPALLIAYLALRDGGYGDAVQQQTAIALWYAIFLGLVFGWLPRRRSQRSAVVTGLLLASFAGWTGLSTLWSDSAELSFHALGLALLYLAVFLVAVLAQSRSVARRWLGGLTVAIAGVSALALFSRMHPAWFPNADVQNFLPDATARLEYPIGYWNGLAFLTAAGIPLLVHFAAQGRAAAVRALATCAMPVCAGTLYLTYSRGGGVAAGLGVLAYLALSPARFKALVPLVLGGLGSLAVIVQIRSSPQLSDGLSGTHAARTQGTNLLLLTLVVTAALFALSLALDSRAARLGPPGWLRASSEHLRRHPRRIAAGVALLLVCGITAAGVTGAISDEWSRFKNPTIAYSGQPGAAQARLLSASSHGRYQFWSVSVRAFEHNPIAGSGAATWEFWWTQLGKLPFYVRNSHSLVMDTLPELGLIGIAILLPLLGYPFYAGYRRWRRGSPGDRQMTAVMLAVVLVLTISLAIDWTWKLPAVAGVYFIALGLMVGGGEERAPERAREGGAPRLRRNRYPLGAAVAAVAWVAIAVEAIPALADMKVQASQTAARSGKLGQAEADARAASAIQPWAVSPAVQLALVQERAHDVRAIGTADAARKREPRNWRNWYVLAQIYAANGQRDHALVALSQARALNPTSALLQSATLPPP